MHKKRSDSWTPVSCWREAFAIEHSDHVALVGGGGKTTTMWSMAREYARLGPTVVTSTTKAGAPPGDVPLVTWAAELPSGHDLQAAMGTALQLSRLVALGSGVRDGRLEGVSPIVVDEVFLRCGAGYIVNEADGARMKPFKAPAEYEPVIPSTTTLCVIVVGLDAIGAPIDEEHLHRPDKIVALTGATMGAPLSAEHVAKIVRVYLERLEGLESVRAAVLVNKADNGPDVPEVAALASALRDLDLAEIVVATQRDGTRLWKM